jgi:hypothetical protein
MDETASNHCEAYVGGSGKIRCLRCTARSKRTGLQCGRPAIKRSKAQKCQFHGGRSTGPKTIEGRARVAAAHWKHGRETLEAKARRTEQSAELLQLEAAARILGVLSGSATRGRKPKGFTAAATIDDVRELAGTER